MPRRVEEPVKIKVEGEKIVIKPEYLISYNNDETRTTYTYLYYLPEIETYVLQIHRTFMEGKDEFQVISKENALDRHEKNHPHKLAEIA